MIGHLQILAARRNGLRPNTVFVEAGLKPMPQGYAFERYEAALAHKLHATVNIPPAELHDRHDFRFLIGCRVVVQGASVDDALIVAERIAEAGAAHVVASGFSDREIVQYKNNQWEAFA